MQQFSPSSLRAWAVLLLFVPPARRRKGVAAQAQTRQESLTVGTPVMTASGLHGTVAGLGDKTAGIEISPGVVVTFARPAILEVRKPAVEAQDVDTTGDDTPGTRPADGTL